MHYSQFCESPKAIMKKKSLKEESKFSKAVKAAHSPITYQRKAE